MRPGKPSLAIALATAVLSACSSSAPKLTPHWAQINGHPIYYATGGSATGEPILFLHGGGSSIRGSFKHQFLAFGERHPLIGIEQVGQGHTPDVPGPLSYANMTEDTAALLKQLKLPPVDAIGFSDGGNIALMLAARYPQLVHRLVITGANLDPGGLHEDDLAEMRDSAPGALQPEGEAPDDSSDPGDDDDEPPLSEKLRQLWLYSPTPDELSPEILHDIRQKTLVMAGSHDAIRREHTMLIYRSLPNARVWILPHTGHSTFSSRPSLVNPAVLSFLDEPP